MAWWKTNLSDDVIGDGAADNITQLCKNINSLYSNQGFTPPNLGEMLAVLIASCNKASELGLITKGGKLTKLKAIYHGDTEESISTELPSKLAIELESLIIEALKEFSEDYQLILNRVPRVTEVFACFAFVLGYKPEDYLSEMKGKSVAVIEPTI